MKKYKQPYSIRNDFRKLKLDVNEALLEILIEKEHNRQKHSPNRNEMFSFSERHLEYPNVFSYRGAYYDGGLER